jgi:ketosteroid isomerase-like protein
MRLSWAVALSCSMLASALLPAGAVSAAEQPIRIMFNGEMLIADSAPFITNGTTLVPFRALFEQLGMTVAWDADTKTITGEGGGVSVVLRVGSNTATIEGTARQLTAAPSIVGGRAFVPLRFVSEAANATVAWNGEERLVTVVTAPPPAAEEAVVESAYREYVRVANLEEAAAVEQMLHPDSPLRSIVRFALADGFERRDVETSVESVVVEGAHGGTAVVYVTELNERLAGAFYLDNRADLRVTMKKDARGVWKLYDVATLSQEWLRPFGPGGQSAAVDPLDMQAAENTIAAYMEALNQEDIQAALQAVHADSPMKAGTDQTLAWMFKTYDLSHELEKTRVIERADDEMYVYTVQVLRKTGGPKLADVRTESIHTLRQQSNGEWKLYASLQGKSEALSIPQ